MQKESSVKLIKDLKFLTEREKSILIKNNIKTLENLVYFFPFRYEESPRAKQIKDLKIGDNVIVSGVIIDIEAKTGYKTQTKFTQAIVADDTESINVIWWNMPFISKTIFPNQKISLTGQVVERNREIFLSNPKIEKLKSLPINADSTLFQNNKKKPQTGIYSSFRNEHNFNIRKILEKVLRSDEFKKLPDIIPKSISDKIHLGSRQNSILRKHYPVTEEDKIVTNKYFAFEEIFVMQIYREQEKILRADAHAYKVNIDDNFRDELQNILPFKLTKGQEKVLETILKDISLNKPMSRLVEGDVGSGKTILALAASLATILTPIKNGKCLQVAYIAPTEILANQHFEFFTKTLSHLKHISIALLTSSGAKIYPAKTKGRNGENWTTAPKSRVKKLLDEGKLNIVIGTHSLFNKSILFEYLGLVIIDEQHRFGVKQRLAMIEKHKEELLWKNTRRKAKNDLREFTGKDFEDEIKLLPIPHLLSMSATPIPRTLALTIYGDLELSILDELPPGRKRAETKIATKFDRDKMYAILIDKLKAGKQAYIIAPRIKEEDISDEELKVASVNKKSSVEFEEKRIKEMFKKQGLDFKIGILHGKQNKVDKEKVIAKFYAQEIDVLISTTVVEVGISVPNATFIAIENADNFGLAQLHQLRGRVERSTEHSICFLVTESENEISLKRLEALVKSNNGFELAEVDLSERGAGSLIGNRQSGLTDIGMEAIKNRRLVEVAKEEAKKVLEIDPNLELQIHQTLKNKIDEFTFHEE